MAYCISLPCFYHVQDPGALTCCGRNDKFQKRRLIVVDDRVIDIVKRVGLEGLYRTPCREIDHNLITAFVERWRPETHTFHLPYGETMITLQDVEVILGIPIDGEAIVGTTEKHGLMNVGVCLESTLQGRCLKEKGS